MDNNSLANLLLTLLVIWLVISVVLIAVVVAVAYFAFRWSQRLITPDVADMNKRLQELQAANPGASTDTLVRKIIHQQSLKAGIVGAITSFGGFIILPVTLPVDILASLRIQATMVQFIAMLYGQGNPNSEELKLQTYLVMSGGVEVTETSFKFIMRLIVRFLGKSFAKIVPLVGAFVGFGVNYALAQATGNIAMRWYASRFSLPTGRAPR